MTRKASRRFKRREAGRHREKQEQYRMRLLAEKMLERGMEPRVSIIRVPVDSKMPPRYFRMSSRVLCEGDALTEDDANGVVGEDCVVMQDDMHDRLFELVAVEQKIPLPGKKLISGSVVSGDAKFAPNCRPEMYVLAEIVSKKEEVYVVGVRTVLSDSPLLVEVDPSDAIES